MKKQEEENTSKLIIPVEGSIGILALGDVGLKEWRAVRDQFEKEKFKLKKKKGGDSEKA